MKSRKKKKRNKKKRKDSRDVESRAIVVARNRGGEFEFRYLDRRRWLLGKPRCGKRVTSDLISRFENERRAEDLVSSPNSARPTLAHLDVNTSWQRAFLAPGRSERLGPNRKAFTFEATCPRSGFYPRTRRNVAADTRELETFHGAMTLRLRRRGHALRQRERVCVCAIRPLLAC